jgi:hypothetical protein
MPPLPGTWTPEASASIGQEATSYVTTPLEIAEDWAGALVDLTVSHDG